MSPPSSVSVPNDEEGRAAISAIDGTDVDGRAIKADQAREPAEVKGEAKLSMSHVAARQEVRQLVEALGL